jgi:translation initiation factor 6 (eIF-6)
MSSLKDGLISTLRLRAKQERIKANAIKENIGRYERTNELVPNTISQQEIDNLWAAYEISEIEIEILETQVNALENLDR